MKIGGLNIISGHKPFIIAEAGINHNGKLDNAFHLVDGAVEAGVDAIKFQGFTATDLALSNAHSAPYQGGGSQLDLLSSYELSIQDFLKIKSYCDQKKILFLSTAHTQDYVDFFGRITPAIKVGSGDLDNHFLLESVAKFKKPIILSTGMSTLDEIKSSLDIIFNYHNDIILLHCTSNYPCSLKDVNLKAMLSLKSEFGLPIGYSDHTEGIEVSLMAAYLGASVIEKHFTLDKKMDGPDHKVSLSITELKELTSRLKSKDYLRPTRLVLGHSRKNPLPSELLMRDISRKKLVTSKEVKKGTCLKKSHLTLKRSSTGLPSSFASFFIGKNPIETIPANVPLLPSSFNSLRVFIASFNRASDGALEYLSKKMDALGILTSSPSEANIFLVPGDRIETFDFALQKYRENKTIVHLWAGEISQGTHDEVYRHSITLMSRMQLCTNPEAKKRVVDLCSSVSKSPNAHVVGNTMLENLKYSEDLVPSTPYNLILYNPPTELSPKQIKEELKSIDRTGNYVWIAPNGDKGSSLVSPYVTHKNLKRDQFLGLLKNCSHFISNSSSMFYEAPFFLDDSQIISIGTRNKDRESGHADMCIPNASNNIIQHILSLFHEK